MSGTGDIIAEVDTAVTEFEPVLASGAIGGPVVAETAILVQQIVDFLHHLFPGHGAPGIPSSAKPAA